MSQTERDPCGKDMWKAETDRDSRTEREKSGQTGPETQIAKQKRGRETLTQREKEWRVKLRMKAKVVV